MSDANARGPEGTSGPPGPGGSAHAAADGRRGEARRGRSPAEIAGGVFLLACALAAWWFGRPLKVGTAFRMGPGFVPMLLAWVVGAFGIVLCVIGLARRGPPLERWPLRPIALVIGAIVVFSVAIERAGLLASSAIVVAMSAMAAPSPRVRQVAVLAAVLAAFACVLFALVLRLPVRILP